MLKGYILGTYPKYLSIPILFSSLDNQRFRLSFREILAHYFVIFVGQLDGLGIKKILVENFHGNLQGTEDSCEEATVCKCFTEFLI